MNERNNLIDTSIIESTNNILKNFNSCIYCEIPTEPFLAKCLVCSHKFCNGKIAGSEQSHIMYHMKSAGHLSLNLPNYGNIKCNETSCENSNFFELLMSKDINKKIIIYCPKHIKGDIDNYTNLIIDNLYISPELLPIPESESDKTKIQNTNIKEISKRENIINDMDPITQRFLNKVKDKYVSSKDYYEIYKPIIVSEKLYSEHITDNKKIYERTIYNKEKLGQNSLFYFKKGDDFSSKMGTVYEFKKSKYDKDYEFLGVIKDINYKDDEIIVYIFNSKIRKFEAKVGKYYIKEKFCDVAFERMLSGLDNFIDETPYCSDEIMHILLGYTVKYSKEKNTLNQLFVKKINLTTSINDFGSLNDKQLEALQKIFKNVFNIIKGPPGTGKTFLACFIIYNILQNIKNEEKILICAPSNDAADNIAMKLIKMFNCLKTNKKILRVCAKTRQYIGSQFNEVEEKSLHNYIYKDQKIMNTIDYDTQIKLIKEKEKKIILKSDIIITTCSASFDIRLTDEIFKYVLVDEAGQSCEPENLLPILHGAQHVILIGDDKQLGPVILNPKAAQVGLKISMFERMVKLYKNTDKFSLLEIQYRMQPEISEFPSKTFYENKIINEAKEQKNQQYLRIFHNKNILFINVDGKDNLSSLGTSYENKLEAQIIAKLILKFPNNISHKNIGIITPYIGQKNLLYSLLSKNDNYNLEISSVDSFQGREKDYIIISTVRSNPQNITGFIKDPRRLNVMLTRAKYGLIILGNVNSLFNAKQNDLIEDDNNKSTVVNKYTVWRNLIEFYKNKGSLVSFNLRTNSFSNYNFNANDVEPYQEIEFDYSGSTNKSNVNKDLIARGNEGDNKKWDNKKNYGNYNYGKGRNYKNNNRWNNDRYRNYSRRNDYYRDNYNNDRYYNYNRKTINNGNYNYRRRRDSYYYGRGY